MNTKIGGALLDGHTVIAVTGDADDIIAELTGVGPGHTDILPAHPSPASQLRCHLIVQQTPPRGCSYVLATILILTAEPSTNRLASAKPRRRYSAYARRL